MYSLHFDISSLPEDLRPTINELPGDLAYVAEIIESKAPGKGVETTIEISRAFRGTYVYCRNTDDIERKIRDSMILKHREDGLIIKDIARRVGLSERRVHEILKVAADKKINKL